MHVGIWAGLVVLAGALHLVGSYASLPVLVYVFKPLTIVLILASAAAARGAESPRYRMLIVVGLVLSLAGDVFLMLPSDAFIQGLASFLVAHVLYIAAFRVGLPWRVVSWAWLPFVLYGAIMFAVLWPGLRDMALPVLAYIAVILTMAWQGWERWRQTRSPRAWLAFVGALLFVFSDSALTLNRFRVAYGASSAVVWITYVAAQWLIARSVGPQQGAAVRAGPLGAG
jgi:uncharacterized membrane protein YhhN